MELGIDVDERFCKEGCEGREDSCSCELRVWKGVGDWKVGKDEKEAAEVGRFWGKKLGTWGKLILPCGT